MANKITSKEIVERTDEYIILDLQEADEVNEDGKIGTATNIPLGQLIRKLRHGIMDGLKAKKIYSYCSGGYRKNIAAEELKNLALTL